MNRTTLAIIGAGLLLGCFGMGCGGGSDPGQEPGGSGGMGSGTSSEPASGSASPSSAGPAAIANPTSVPSSGTAPGSPASSSGSSPLAPANAAVPSRTYAALFNDPSGARVTPNVLSGVWGASWTSTAGVNLDARLDFTADHMTLASHCMFPDGASLYAGVIAAARIDGSDITILQGEADQKRFGLDDCSVNLDTGALPYNLNQLDLLLPSLTGRGVTFVKIRD
jgi:hypothetical protein